MKESGGVVIRSGNAGSHLQRLSPLRAKGEREVSQGGFILIKLLV